MLNDWQTQIAAGLEKQCSLSSTNAKHVAAHFEDIESFLTTNSRSGEQAKDYYAGLKKLNTKSRKNSPLGLNDKQVKDILDFKESVSLLYNELILLFPQDFDRCKACKIVGSLINVKGVFIEIERLQELEKIGVPLTNDEQECVSSITDKLEQNYKEIVLKRAELVAQKLCYEWSSALEDILRVCLLHPKLFPTKKKKQVNDVKKIDNIYLRTYVQDYYKERNGTLEKLVSNTKPDPMLYEVLKLYYNLSPDADFEFILNAHRDAMLAENLIGTLLERYISEPVEKNGWVWCCGQTVKAVDFIKYNKKLDKLEEALQIKNRSNSENSSSKSIRELLEKEGITVKKWHRLDAKSGKDYWDNLTENKQECGALILTEEGFREFIHSSKSQMNVIEESAELDDESGLEESEEAVD